MIFSKVFPITLVREMGLYDWGSEAFELGLRIGITTADFQLSGYKVDSNILLKSDVR